MLEALAATGHKDEAIKLISDYWGAMLDLGATTFWEDLKYSDVANAAPDNVDIGTCIAATAGNDAKRGGLLAVVGLYFYFIHTPEAPFGTGKHIGGAYCYKGLRLSLCHGWASGPTAWLSRHDADVRY